MHIHPPRPEGSNGPEIPATPSSLNTLAQKVTAATKGRFPLLTGTNRKINATTAPNNPAQKTTAKLTSQFF